MAEAVKEAAGASETIVLGNGYGGFVALQMAIRHPAIASRLILADCGAAFSDSGREAFRNMAAASRAKGLAAITDALQTAARGHDLILTSGGVSAGEEDHVRAAVEALGQLVFWRLAVKPGRPVTMGVVGGVPFMGLPGNPVAAFVTFAQLARPMLAALSGSRVDPLPTLRLPAAFAYRKKAGRREYVRARLLPGPDGAFAAHKHEVDGAGILTSLTATDGLVELADDVTRVVPGDIVAFMPYALLF